ncbi:PPM1 [Candida oxycetoniae]|uniref:Leucine carboxyl methyltransferase 1 n=1 Tax=Candida oxycetoniae TaxID=497107 RepID=A0AAI9SSV4_9ASCO|nr:PPM1 [Candida oxycetoniae]KAI3402319.2 PPM1 [Candida oxycetoniae]
MSAVPSVSLTEHVEPVLQEELYVHEIYNEIAPHFSQTRYKPWPIVEKFLKSRPKYSVGLDVGCGNGKYLHVNEDLFIVGTDRSGGLVDCAQKLSNNAYNLGIADGLSLPHPRDRFDFAISIAVIHHFANEERRIEAISQILSKLKKGGQCLIYCWALEQEKSRRGYKDGDDQDVLVPWVLKKPVANVEKKRRDKAKAQSQASPEAVTDHQEQVSEPEVTKYRYYHLYRKEDIFTTYMYSPQDKHEKLIRATDLDALSCRCSINEKQYLLPKDLYIQDLVKSYEANLRWCQGYSSMSSARTLKGVFTENKLPLINRGTYLRTKVISTLILEFIQEFDGHCQIVSLGSGSDTRLFQFIEDGSNAIYHEIDFPEVARIKKLGILHSEKLRSVLGVFDNPPTISSKEDFSALDPEIHTTNYHLHGRDLRDIDAKSSIPGLDMTKPTLVISECVLCYMSPENYKHVIDTWIGLGKSLTSFLIYEPMSLRDSFGEMMLSNLQSRGLDLQTFDKYPTLEARCAFLKKCGLENLHLTDLCHIGGYDGYNREGNKWIDPLELKRINKLEFVDEVEEIKLLLEHYCLCYADKRHCTGAPIFSKINKWDWMISESTNT